jgi:hypothetical protein
MSHEPRTRLSASIGCSELLVEVESLGEIAILIAEGPCRIETGARHLLSFINGVLDLS